MPGVDAPVGTRISGIGSDRGRNAQVTWKHLLQQTSEWEGECFGVPDTLDRYRSVQFQEVAPAGNKGDPRLLQEPGCYWEYNDARVNQLSLALMHLFGRPLADVFRDSIIQPIGAGDGWRWVGYDNSWIDLDGRRVHSVPGGSHWGGGLSIVSLDQARVGQLLLDQGRANCHQVISAASIKSMLTPCAIAQFYGYLTWLNRTRRAFPSVPASSSFAIGAGT